MCEIENFMFHPLSGSGFMELKQIPMNGNA